MNDFDVCPKCGEELSFETFEMVDGGNGFFEAECFSCGFEGRQWSKLHFQAWQELKENGQYEDIKIEEIDNESKNCKR